MNLNLYSIFLTAFTFGAVCFATARPEGENLALNRPVTVSSTDHAPTQGEFGA